jgi:hypothetical protein
VHGLQGFADAATRIVRIGAESGQHRDVHGQQTTVAIDRKAAVDAGFAGVDVADE